MTTTANLTGQMQQRGVIVAIAGALLGTIALASLSDASLRPSSAIAPQRAATLVVAFDNVISAGASCTALPTRTASARSALPASGMQAAKGAGCDVASR